MDILDIKSAQFTTRPNKYLIPVTITTSVEEFNNVYLYFKSREDKHLIKYGFKRTKSGGISITNPRNFLNCYEVTVSNLGVELMVYTIADNNKPLIFRLQYRTNTFKNEHTGEEKSFSGAHAFNIFNKICKSRGLDISDLFIDRDKVDEVKKSIKSPLLGCYKESFRNRTFEHVYHIDLNSAYPAGMAKAEPRLAPIIQELYDKRKDIPEYKIVLNAGMFGYFQSTKPGNLVHGQLAHLSKAGMDYCRDMLFKVTKFLEDKGFVIIYYNTDGVWFLSPETQSSHDIIQRFNSHLLGQFKLDHSNCRFRAKDNGTYEYIEDGKYYPVAKGRRKLDKVKPRSQWTWGDIYNNDTVIQYTFNKDKGIIEYEA